MLLLNVSTHLSWKVIWAFLTLKGLWNVWYMANYTLKSICQHKKVLFIQIQWHSLYKETKWQFNMSAFIWTILHFCFHLHVYYTFAIPVRLVQERLFKGTILRKYFWYRTVQFQCLFTAQVFYLHFMSPNWHQMVSTLYDKAELHVY